MIAIESIKRGTRNLEASKKVGDEVDGAVWS
jgi:hypothetical protein